MQNFRVSHHGKSNKKVVFLLGGWTYRKYMLYIPSKILEKSGYYCISYTYSDEVFSPNVQKTVKELQAIKTAVLDHIKLLKNEGYTSFAIFGTSLGSALAVLIANESPDISKMILNTAGAGMAESVWNGILYDRFINEFKKQNINYESLISKWQSISPQLHMNHLGNKQLLIYLSKKDTTIPYAQGEKFVQKCKEYNYNYKTVINYKLGHAATGIYNLLHPHKYLNFLKQ